MAHAISLQKVIDALLDLSNSSRAYLNIRTGETYVVFEDLGGLEDGFDAQDDEPADTLKDWEKDDLKIRRAIAEGTDWKDLPSSFEINEWQMLKAFTDSQPPGRIRDALADAIHGKGAFRTFRTIVERHGLKQQWHRFRDESLKKIAIEWLEDEGLKYLDDTKPVSNE